MKANKLLRRSREFWEREYLDRYVRNAEHYEKGIASHRREPGESRGWRS